MGYWQELLSGELLQTNGINRGEAGFQHADPLLRSVTACHPAANGLGAVFFAHRPCYAHRRWRRDWKISYGRTWYEKLRGLVRIVLFAMAGTAFSETKATAEEARGGPGQGVKMEMVLIPAGEFMMGSGESAEATAAFFNKTFGDDFLKADFFKDEHPQHRVRITKPFYLGTYHVTRGQFRQFVADSGYKTDAEKGDTKGASAGTLTKSLRLQREILLAERGFRADRRAPGGQRELERRGGLLQVA